MSDLSTTELDLVVARVAAHMGLCIPASRRRNLEEAFRAAAQDLGFQDTRACVAWFLSTPPSRDLIETMASYLTVGETYFFREPGSFESLVQEIIPEIIRTRQGGERHLRIWSAGCASGEEPYTIAILLYRMRESLRGWELSILATDISPPALAKARTGVYPAWSFRNTPPWFKEHYFHKTPEGRYALLPKIKEMVHFSYLNLAENLPPAHPLWSNTIDVIFCRNVLMYFTPEGARAVVMRFHRSLLATGWLMVSPCEAGTAIFSGFTPIHRPDTTLYRKQGDGVTSGPRTVAREAAFAGRGLPAAPPSQETPDPDNRESPGHPAVAAESLPELPLPSLAPLPPTPPPAPLLNDQVHALYDQGAYPEAATLVEAHLTHHQGDIRALALLARIYANQGRLPEAHSLVDQALATDKLDAGLHYLRALILQEEGLIEEAITALKRALYLDQEMVQAHFTLGNLTLRQGKSKESTRHFTNAMALLAKFHPEAPLPAFDGIPAERVREMIQATTTTP